MKKLLLASTSPRRKQILEQIGLAFEVIGCDYEEDMMLDVIPEELVKILSKGKADSIETNDNDAIIISADTVVAHNGQVLGKPKTEQEAAKMLKMLSGTRHQVVTGFTVRDVETGESISEAVTVDIEFEHLTEEIIQQYIATGEPMDKAGAYAIQGKGAVFITGMYGDYYGVVGLPVVPLLKVLKRFGIVPFSA